MRKTPNEIARKIAITAAPCASCGNPSGLKNILPWKWKKIFTGHFERSLRKSVTLKTNNFEIAFWSVFSCLVSYEKSVTWKNVSLREMNHFGNGSLRIWFTLKIGSFKSDYSEKWVTLKIDLFEKKWLLRKMGYFETGRFEYGSIKKKQC